MKEEAVWVWRYELSSAVGALNRASVRRTFPGALVRRGAGFACVHTWPELGDASLEESLNNLSPQVLACLELDGQARLEGRSLFHKVKVPPSHATLPSIKDLSRADGFTHVKVKARAGADLEEIRQAVVVNSHLVWRLDFNGAGTPEMFGDWSDEELACLDFVEDPFQPDGMLSWSDLPVATANDRYRGGGEIEVIKPAVDPVKPSELRTIITSYMDHPLGQSFAAYQARLFPEEIHGLQTHGLFTPDEFTEALGPVMPEFHPAPGTGLGFDDLLEKLPWKKLS